MRTIAKVIEDKLTSAVTQPGTGQTSAVPSRGVWSWGGAGDTSTAS